MKRGLWAVMATLVFAGLSAGQSPLPPVELPAYAPSRWTTDGPRDGDILTARTAGQPDRRVKVLRITRYRDGETLADLQDLSTGAKYTVPGKVLATMTPAPAGEVPPSPPSRTAPKAGANGWPVSASAKPIARPEVPGIPVEARSPVAPALALPMSACRGEESPPAPLAPPEPTPVGHVGLPDHSAAMSHAEEELRPYLDHLANALRPSTREWAASALAESRHGWRPEVKAILFKASRTDPAPSVRAHCLRLLVRLGYHEPAFVRHLEEASSDQSATIRQTAGIALIQLTGRR